MAERVITLVIPCPDGRPDLVRHVKPSYIYCGICGRTPDERVMTLVPEHASDVASFVQRLVRSLDQAEAPAAPAAEAPAAEGADE